jgi:hypothetical protein
MSEQTPPRITMNAEFVEAAQTINEFAGEIVSDIYKAKPERMGGGWQWEIAVKPLKGFVKGKTGALHDWIDVKLEDGKPKKGTKLQIVFDAFQEVFGASDTPIGEGAFVGKVAMFARYEKNWGVNQKTQQEMKGQIMTPTRPLTDDELREYGLLGVNDATAFAWTGELIAEAVEALDGTKTKDVKRAIINAGFEDQTMTQKLLNGEGVEALIARGVLVLDGDTYKRA